MTRLEFLELLEQNRIDIKIVSFEPELKDGYCVRKNRLRWEVFVRERGVEYDLMGFPSEDDSLQYLFKMLLRIYGKHN